jgi:hypothetical protein
MDTLSTSAQYTAPIASAAMFSYVVRVWVPDRPGALGQVASRIGSVRGDVVGIEILERGAGMAIDELIVTLPDDDLVDLLVAEIGQVDGAAVEEVRHVASDRPDSSIVALQAASRLVGVEPAKRLDQFCREVVDLVDGSWSVALDLAECVHVVELGDAPDPKWLAAFVAGSRHLAVTEREMGAPPDLAWTILDEPGVAIVVGRSGWAFRARERQQIDLLGEIASGLLVRRPVP